jgi:uncharacterized protein
MLDFQKYQIAFTAHIRDPKHNPKPAKVKNSRMAVYREIVFNNIFSSVTACYPVCKNILGKRKWQQLCRAFFAQHQANSPLFREIPAIFLNFINTHDLAYLKLPVFITQLAHYEWAELAVSNMADQPHQLSIHTDLLEQQPILASAHMLLEYDYPVHIISKRVQPTAQSKTHILMFRNNEFKVRFIELNVITFELLNLIKNHTLTGKQALIQIAETIQHPEPDAIVQFGEGILQDLMLQEAVIGSQTI